MKTTYHPFHYISEILRLASLIDSRNFWQQLVLLFHSDVNGSELYQLSDKTRNLISQLIVINQTEKNKSTMNLISQNLAEM